ncbi:hypothetical protein T265_11084 [Opisthorchis viverrini]|uniref:UBA domain-containing protein n=1 Tax=Opisthorchis viverrini TaxID=6198 RepID=A0A074Z0A1_OPIVI|nr:hypothetical protein T265_11084 [Opisthorchis viverrini]KER20353.1 hypothetical protein T265_11084 [Opisthorchis viverrini]
MSQSDDQMPFNLWGNNDFWSSAAQSELTRTDVWAPATKLSTSAKHSKLNGIVSPRDSEKGCEEKKSVDVATSMPWAAIGSVLHEVDLPSIWSAPKLYPSIDQNLSLSDSVPWAPGLHNSSNDALDRAPSVELWDSSRDPLLFPVPTLDQDNVWKTSSICPNDSTPTEMAANPDIQFAANTSTSTSCTSSSFTPHVSVSGAFDAETGSSRKNPSLTEDSSSLATLSTEQLCDHLINSNEGWGRRPIDQTIPWDFTDLLKAGDQLVRSGITTPTPAPRPSGGGSGTSFTAFRAPLQAQSTLESNVWTNETPTGTAIWEMHYENTAARGSVWHPSLTPPSAPVPSTSGQASTTPVLFLNTASGRNVPTPSNSVLNRGAANRPWDQSDSSSRKNPSLTEDSSSLATLSTEQLCDHLINSNEGWGRRPIDQTIPWDFTDLLKAGDQLVRSGITTPTPAPRPSGGGSGTSFTAFRAPLQAQSTLESNVWTNETPTGTAIWEMHYENTAARGSVWHPSLTPPSAPVPSTSGQASTTPVLFLNTASGRNVPTPSNSVLNRGAANRPWDQSDKMWTPGNGTINSGRPVLGSARGTIAGVSQTDEIPSWCGGDASGLNNGNMLVEGGNVNTTSWDGFPVATASPLQWNSNVGGSFMTTEEQRRNQSVNNLATNGQVPVERMVINPFNNTYRADSVKYLMSHGFKKEEALPALIDCNMDPERALHELRERFNNTRSAINMPSSGAAGFQSGLGNMASPFQNTNNFTQSNQHPGSVCAPSMLTSSGAGPPLFSGPNQRAKLPGAQNNSSALPMMTMANHPNPQLIRQQLTQQVRSALNLSLPSNPMNGPIGNNSVGVAGTSLLGQPPPPLLNGGSGATLPGALTPSNGPNFLSSHSRNPGGIPGALTPFASNLPNTGKRSARQMTIISAIQDLHKKHQSIQQQIIMYRNNPTMCSQPQYADLFTELQGQMQQIEAQLKAKQAQLNIAYAQDCAAAAASSTLGHSSSPLGDVNGPGISVLNPNAPSSVPSGNASLTNNNGQTLGVFQHSRTNPDQLVQQLMELRLRPGGSSGGSAMDGETEFPTIGTWTPYRSGNMDNPDKDVSGPRSVAGQRAAIGKNRSHPTWGSNTWQPTYHRTNVHNTSNWSASHVDGAIAMTHPNGLKSSNIQPAVGGGGGMAEQQSSGPWLLIQPTPTGGLGSNLNLLHNLLCHYGLTYFHALNPASGSVLVRLQSPEYAFQMMRALGDRLTVESITEPEKFLQLQRNMNSRENYAPSQFSPPCDTSVTASSWTLCDPSGNPTFVSAANTAFPTKKPTTAHNSSRLGVMVSGIH